MSRSPYSMTSKNRTHRPEVTGRPGRLVFGRNTLCQVKVDQSPSISHPSSMIKHDVSKADIPVQNSPLQKHGLMTWYKDETGLEVDWAGRLPTTASLNARNRDIGLGADEMSPSYFTISKRHRIRFDSFKLTFSSFFGSSRNG